MTVLTPLKVDWNALKDHKILSSDHSVVKASNWRGFYLKKMRDHINLIFQGIFYLTLQKIIWLIILNYDVMNTNLHIRFYGHMERLKLIFNMIEIKSLTIKTIFKIHLLYY